METFRQTRLLISLTLLVLSFAESSSFTPNVSHYLACGSTTNVDRPKDSPSRTFLPDGPYLSDKHSHSISNPNNSSDSLYSTARVSSTKFTYKFNMEPNSSNVLRFHFLPFSAQSHDLSTAKFSVQAVNIYKLLDSFTVTNTTSPTIKEFFLWTDSSILELEFIPASKLAFVSAIEVFTAPEKLLSAVAPIFINNAAINWDLKKQVLETLYRVNMAGPLITSQNDTMWRTWVTDDPYISGTIIGSQYNVSINLINYNPSEGRTKEIAPPMVYSTARLLNVPRDQIISNPLYKVNLTWTFNVTSPGYHLIRLHFCDIISLTNRLDQGIVFTVYIMGHYAKQQLKPSNQDVSNPQEPFYIDFITQVMSDQKINVSISLDTKDSTPYQDAYFAYLNGLEIMKVNPSSGGKRSQFATIVASIGGGGVIVLILSCVILTFCKKRRQKLKSDAKENQLMWSPTTGGINSVDISSKSGGATTIGASPRVDLGLLISFAQIKMATNNFDERNLIGEGGFGKVYRGVLSDGLEVAVKRATVKSQQGFPEFRTEIEVLTQIRHRHLVSLIGYCDERSEMILVYEYMEKGPLRKYLYGNNELPSLSWNQRLKVCIEAAQGLHYLHTGHSQTIIHRDVKTTNILLGEGYVAKVSDFGLSKLGATMGDTHVSTAVKGTFGYLDPEYFKTQKLTDKSDVYSFGVTLLEVLCARPAIDQSLPREEINLAEWALMWERQGQLEKVIDQRLAGKINENSLRKFWEITERCLQDFGVDRPAMGDVLWHLEYCLQLQEIDVRHELYDDSGTSAAHFPVLPKTRRMPSSTVSHETGTSGDSKSDIANSNVFSQLLSNEGR